jgi:hypothetical protein
MKIQSNFTDYYDKALAFGTDDDIFFKRISVTEQRYDDSFYYTLRQHSLPINNLTLTVRPVAIGFCGVIYRGVTLEYFDWSYKHYRDTFYGEVPCIKHIHKFVEYARREFPLSKKDKDNLKDETPWVENYFRGLDNNNLFRRTENESYAKLDKYLTPIFEKENVPYFSITTIGDRMNWDAKNIYEVTILPVLKKYDFIKLKDPIQAFQEISMYVGEVLRQPVNPMVEISNKDMAIKKGFGHKYAFRKEPKEKKK